MIRLLADRLVQNLAKRLTAFADELRRVDTLLGKEAAAAAAAAKPANLEVPAEAEAAKALPQVALAAPTP